MVALMLAMLVGGMAHAGERAPGPPPWFGYTERTESGVPVLLILVPGHGDQRDAIYSETLHEADNITRPYGRGVAPSHFVALSATKTVPFIVSADGNPVDPRWLKPFVDGTPVVVLRRHSPPLRVAEKFSKGAPPSFGLLDDDGNLRRVQVVWRHVNDDVAIVRKDRTDKETWRITQLSLSLPAAAAKEWRSPAQKSIDAPKAAATVFVVPPDQELDALWRSLLRPDAAIAVVAPSK